MKSERTLELLKHFQDHGINRDTTGRVLILEYQDCIMQAKPFEIKEFERDLDHRHRQLFFWANSNTLGMDSFLDILKQTYITRKVEDMLEKEDNRQCAQWDKLTKAQNIFRDCKRSYWKRIAKMRAKVLDLTGAVAHYRARNTRLDEANTRLIAYNRQLKDKADKFDKLQALLK